MTELQKVKRALRRAGLNLYRTLTVYNTARGDVPGIMVYHDYSGPYPTRAALDAHGAAARIAARHGLTAEKRGHCTGTLIYYK